MRRSATQAGNPATRRRICIHLSLALIVFSVALALPVGAFAFAPSGGSAAQTSWTSAAPQGVAPTAGSWARQAGKSIKLKPGKPTAMAPKGTVATAAPTFRWSTAKNAAKYELRVYQGKKVVLKKAGLGVGPS